MAALSAALAFIVGATWIGAEWSTRSIVALLFWVPRRLTVMGVKIAVLVVAAAVFGVLTQAAGWRRPASWTPSRGRARRCPTGSGARSCRPRRAAVLLTVFAALLGFGLTNLVRNTGAALGIAFVYVVVVENATRIFRPHWDPFLLSTNAVGLVQDGGYTLQIWDESSISADGSIVPVEYYLGPLQSAVFLGAVATVIVCIGVLLFTRRDVH